MKGHEESIFRCGNILLVPSERLLLQGGQAVEITGKAFDILAALMRDPGHLVSKDQLLQQVWPGLVVEEVNLSVNVSAIRKVLARSTGGAGWIETVARQGYRFVGPVEFEDIATLNLAQLRGGVSAGPPVTAAPAPVATGSSRRTLAWVLAGALGVLVAAFIAWQAAGRSAPYDSVALLPFSVDVPASAYLADGISDSLIDRLTLVRELRVTPRASTLGFKGRLIDARDAGRRLNAATVVTGTLEERGKDLKLKLELFDVARQHSVWKSTYEIPATDLPNLPARLAADLLRELRVHPADAQINALGNRPTTNDAAYRAYLQGRFLWNERSEDGLQRAIGHFHRAIELDADFALAYAALADAHTALGYLSYVAPVGTFPVARPYALKALELDPSLAQAHASLAYIKFYFDWDWAGAREEFTRAIALNPADPLAHQWHAVYLLATGDPDAASREIGIAQRLDPLSLAINTDIGFHHYYNGREAQAIAQLQSVLGMKGDFLPAHLWMARALVESARYEEALAETASAERVAREWPVLVAARGYTFGVAGRRDEARSVLLEMQALSTHRFVTAYGVALVHAGLGQKDEAFAWLDKAFEERSNWLVWLRLDPRWKTLRDDPRFTAFVERLKFPA
ncbi:winged helix-turn-helix domain-containing protein [Variovorax sp. J22R133]|uniref:winged helix-turn-helix domain-containing protein n=1 Tax=Variovorax brevis TaxID=3053503 RepID=UPI00257611B7|nr:winged helix-turn-helix domain-containing protein [Variovorax sp. J22R133]MDM0115210.1 winged helix-turn-helix domain-containing protein [Variovorax sp. J22R133]